MTVAELIEELTRLPAHLPVLVESIEQPVDEPRFMWPVTRSHASVAGVAMKYNHVIIDASGGIL